MERLIVINSPVNHKLSQSWSFKLVAKIVINAVVDEKIEIDIKQYDNEKNKIPFLAQRDASWIRLFFNDQTYLDFVSSEILLIGSESGILINLLGVCDEFNDELVATRIANYAKKEGLRKVSRKLEFNYRKHMGQQIKAKINGIMRIKSNILIDKFKYANNRRKILKQAIGLLVEKKYVEENWVSVAGRVSRELDRIYNE